VVAAANAFLATLNDTQRSQAVFDFTNASAKAQWSNLPRGLFDWAGVRMGDLGQARQQAVRDVLTATLSQKGHGRLMAAVNADEELKSQSGNNPLQFGAENYFVAVFGTPSTTAPWMFRFGGHHMTINATVAGSNIALTPSFPGCQPCEYTANNQTVRPVGEVTDKAFKLIGAQTVDLVLGANQPMWIEFSTRGGGGPGGGGLGLGGTPTANHVHAITRDPTNDYGTDWLGLHYEEGNPIPGGPGGAPPGGGTPTP
jgi:hypothetical protein